MRVLSLSLVYHMEPEHIVNKKLEVHSVEHMYLRRRCSDGSR